jgi:hypothetical protein
MKDEKYGFDWESSEEHFTKHYAAGGNSGGGSRGDVAIFKAQVLNAFVKANDVRSVIDFGCGDGYQLGLAEYPEYMGLDIAPGAIDLCCEKFKDDDTKDFKLVNQYAGEQAELAISLDVLLHIWEDEIWEEYLHRLFDSATRYVIIYAADMNLKLEGCQRYRKFTGWIKENVDGWQLMRRIPNKYPDTIPPTDDSKSNADFYIYKRNNWI